MSRISLNSLKSTLSSFRSLPANIHNIASDESMIRCKGLFDLVERVSKWIADLEGKDAVNLHGKSSEVSLCLELLFDASELAEGWLSVAYFHRRADTGVDDLLNVIRVVPNHIAGLLQVVRKTGDLDLCKSILTTCDRQSRLAGTGRRCGDPKTMHHTLDLVFRIHKISVVLKKANANGFSDLADSWIACMSGINADATASSLGKQLFHAKSQADFASACYNLVRIVEFDSEEEATMSIPCLGVTLTIDGTVHDLSNFANSDLGIGRFSLNIFGGDSPLWLDISFWSIRQLHKSSVPGRKGETFELVCDVLPSYSLVQLLQALDIPLQRSGEVTLAFRMQTKASVDHIIGMLDARRKCFVLAERTSVSRMAVNVSIEPPAKAKDLSKQPAENNKTKPTVTANQDEDFSQEPGGKGRKNKTTMNIADAMESTAKNVDAPKTKYAEQASEDDGKSFAVASVVTKGTKASKKFKVPETRVDSSVFSKYTLRELEVYCFTHYPMSVFDKFFSGGTKSRKGDIVKALQEEDAKEEKSKKVSSITEGNSKMPARDYTRDSDAFLTPVSDKQSRERKKLKADGKKTNDTSEPTSFGKQPAIALTIDTDPKPKSKQEELDEFDFLGTSSKPDSIPKITPAKEMSKKNEAVAEKSTKLFAPKKQPKSKGRRELQTIMDNISDRDSFGNSRQDQPKQLVKESVPSKRTGLQEQPLTLQDAFATDSLLSSPQTKTTFKQTKQGEGSKQSIKTTEDASVHHQPAEIKPIAAAPNRSHQNARSSSGSPSIASPVPVANKSKLSFPSVGKKRVITFREIDDSQVELEDPPAFGSAKKRLLRAFNQSEPDDADYYDDENEMFDLEASDVREEVLLECDRSVRAIRRVIQKINLRRVRCSKQIERRVRSLLTDATHDLKAINEIRDNFTREHQNYVKLIGEIKQRKEHRKAELASRHQLLQQLKSETSQIVREMIRARKDAQEHAKALASNANANAMQQVSELKKLVEKQKKEAKGWKNLQVTS